MAGEQSDLVRNRRECVASAANQAATFGLLRSFAFLNLRSDLKAFSLRERIGQVVIMRVPASTGQSCQKFLATRRLRFAVGGL